MSDEITKQWRMRVPGLRNHALPGDSVPETMEILSLSHGIHFDPGYAGSSPQVHVQDLNLYRYSDAATPVFMKLCATADPMPQVFFDLVTQKGGVEIARMEYELVNARVSSLSPGGSGGGPDGLSEGLTLRFEKLKLRVVQGGNTSHVDLVPQRK